MQEILVEKLIDLQGWPLYGLLEGVLRFKDRVVIGPDGDLSKRVVLHLIILIFVAMLEYTTPIDA